MGIRETLIVTALLLFITLLPQSANSAPTSILHVKRDSPDPEDKFTEGREFTGLQRQSTVPLFLRCSVEFRKELRPDSYLQRGKHQIPTFNLQFTIRPPPGPPQKRPLTCHMTHQDFESKLNSLEGQELTVFLVLLCHIPRTKVVLVDDVKKAGGDIPPCKDREAGDDGDDDNKDNNKGGTNDNNTAEQHQTFSRYISYLRVEKCQISMDVVNVVSDLTDLRVVIMYDSGISDFLKVRTSQRQCHGFRNVVSLAIMNDWNTSSYLRNIQYCGTNLENVVEMALNNDSLASFPDQLKTIFPNLTSLEINNNSLASPFDFPWKEGFFRLPLNLSRPALHDFKYTYAGSLVVPADTFRREFLLDGNRIANLTHFRFSSDFQYISLQWNRMRTIAEETFRDVASLQFLSLAHNELTSLPASLFANLTNLMRLDLQDNCLQNLPAGIFGNLRKLRQLNLENNRLTVLESGLFANLVRLEVLLLGNNNIYVVSDGAFSTGLSIMLNTVDLQGNPLREIPVFAFQLSGLQQLNLDRTRIAVLDFVRIDRLTTLAHLFEVQRNPTIQRFINLHEKPENQKVVTLRESGLRSIELYNASAETFDTFLLLLKYFNFVTGPQWRCDCNILNASHALRLLVTQSLLTGDEGSVGGWVCGWPEELAIQKRSLISLRDEDTYCPLAEDSRGSCPHPCACYVRARVGTVIVDCRHNNITSLPKKVPLATRELWLQDNIIKTLQGRPYLEHIQVLKLSSNRLQALPRDIFNRMTSLQILHVDDNLLTELSTEVAAEGGGRHLREVRISGNPYRCDCRTRWMKNWLLNSQANVSDWMKVKCSEPDADGSVLVSVPDENFICRIATASDSRTRLTLAVVCTLTSCFLLLLLIIIALVKRRQLKLLVYVYTGLHPFDLEKVKPALYDVAVCCAAGSRDWILEKVVTRFEQEHAYRVFFHNRDAFLGFTISDNVRHCVNNSRRLVVVLGKGWQEEEVLVAAAREGLAKCRKELVNFLVVVLHQATCRDIQVKEVRQFIARGRFIATEDKHFFKKLAYEMPHLTHRVRRAHPGTLPRQPQSSCLYGCVDDQNATAVAENEHNVFLERPLTFFNHQTHFYQTCYCRALVSHRKALTSDKLCANHGTSVGVSDLQSGSHRPKQTNSGANNSDSAANSTDSGANNSDSESDSTVSNENNTDSFLDNTDSGLDNTDCGENNTESCSDKTDSGTKTIDSAAKDRDFPLLIFPPSIVLRNSMREVSLARSGQEELEGSGKSIFVWCSEADLEATLHTVVAPLEEAGHRCILKDRDFVVGLSIQENIVRAAEACQRAIFVLSSASCACGWLLFAFHVTFDRGLQSSDQRVLLLCRRGLDVERLVMEVQHAVRTTAVLCEDDPWFMRRLQRFVSCDTNQI